MERLILFNFSNEEYAIKRGGCITQMIIECYYSPNFVEVGKFTKEKPEWGEGGFGSIGIYVFCCLLLVLKVNVFIKNGKILWQYCYFWKKLYC